MYYNYQKILSYNAFINILVGERGVGKTYGITKYIVKKFLQNGDQFAYIRRYKNELDQGLPTFFDEIQKEFPNVEFKIQGKKLMINNQTAGFATLLSKAQALKGSTYNKVKYIIFDEFIVEDDGMHRYIKNEVKLFFGLIETLTRMRKTQVFMLGNAETMLNPYFIELNITMPKHTDIITFKNGRILFQYMDNPEYREKKKNSDLGIVTEGTSYADMAINNKFDANLYNDFIDTKKGTAKCRLAFVFRNKYYGVWYDYNEGRIYISYDYYKNIQIFSFTTTDHKPNTMLINTVKNISNWRTVMENYKLGNVYYESPQIQNEFYDILKLFLRK